MFIDEDDDHDKYWESLQNAMKNDPASAENNRKFMELSSPKEWPKGLPRVDRNGRAESRSQSLSVQAMDIGDDVAK